MDPVDPKRRGRRLFGRRRHEHAAEDQMDEPTTSVPDVNASRTDPEATPEAGAEPVALDPAAATPAIGTLEATSIGASGSAPTTDEVDPASDEPVVLDDDDIEVLSADGRESDVTEDLPAPVPADPPPDALAASRTGGTVGVAGTAPVEEVPGHDGSDTPPAGGAPTSDAAADPEGGPDDGIEAGEAEDEGVEPYELPRIIAIANQKGGVGKTTTSVNLGAALAEMGYRVLVVDLDPQGNATTGLGVNARELEGSVYDVIMNDAPVEDCVEPTSLKHLFVVPATIDLAGAEIELVPAFSRELKLRRALARDPRRLRLHHHRLPAVARAAHRQRTRRGGRCRRPDPVRVLRARGSQPAHPERVAGAEEPQPVALRPRDRAHHVRRPHQARRPGRAGGPQPLRPDGVSNGGAEDGTPLGGARRSDNRSSCSTPPRAAPWRIASWPRR